MDEDYLKDCLLEFLFDFYREVGSTAWVSIRVVEQKLFPKVGIFDIQKIALDLVEFMYADAENLRQKNERLRLTSVGLSFVSAGYRFYEGPRGDSLAGAPTADGFVTLNHNSQNFRAAAESLESLEKSLIAANDTGDLSEEDRETAIAEVSSLKRLLEAAKVRSGPFIQLSKSSLNWIVSKAGTAAIGELAKRALDFIFKLFV